MRRHRKLLVLVAAILVSSSVVWLAVAGAMRRKADRAEEVHRRKEAAQGLALVEIGRARLWLDKARSYLFRKELQRGEFVRDAEEAAEFARSAARIAPDLPVGWYYLAQVEEVVGDWDEAAADCRRAIALDPHFAPARALLGRLLVEHAFEIGYVVKPDSAVERKKSIHSEASIHLMAALESGTGWESALQRASAQYNLTVAEGKPAQVLDFLREQRGGYGGGEWEHLRAFEAFSERDPQRRVKILDSVLRGRPHFYLPLVDRGKALVEVGEFDRALEDLDRAVALYPQRGVAYLVRSLAHSGKGDVTAAMDDLSEVIQQGNAGAGPYYNRGFLRGRQGDREGALRDYARAIELNDGFSNAYNNRGAIYVDLGRFDEALRDFEKVIALAPLDATAYYNRAWVFGLKGETGKAIAAYTEAIRVHPGDAGGYLERALLYEKTGDRRGAAGDAREALQRELSATQREAMSDLLKRLGEAP